MNFRRSAVISTVLGACMVGLTCAGCQSETSSTQGGAAARPGPKESFDGIVQFVRRQLETGTSEIPSGFVMEKHGRRSQFVIRNDVTSELIPPSKEGEAYRATITVTSKSTYSLRRTEESERTDGDNGKRGSDEGYESGSLLGDSDADSSGFAVFDNDLVSPAPKSGAKDKDAAAEDATTVVTRQVDEDESKFDFAYENGKWVLKTEPDPETERSIKAAFERALRMQP